MGAINHAARFWRRRERMVVRMAKGLHGGIWLELRKQPACDRPIDVMPAPGKVYLPLAQHLGEPCVPVVKAGDAVKLGQTVAKAGEGISCALHSPVSGTVEDIRECVMPTGAKCPMIIIENDGRDRACASICPKDAGSLSPDEILGLVKDAAISSVSVLEEPLWSKLEKMKNAGVKTLIINAVETEPFICSSQKLLDDDPDEVAEGLSLMMRCVGAEKCLLAVSDDINPDIAQGMVESAHLAGLELGLERIHQKYPSGYERYLIGLITGDSKLRDAKKAHAGFVYAEECADLSRAADHGIPQISRVITVAGDAVGNPQNVEVRIGTTVRAVLEHCGLIFDPERIVLGSAMRGVAVTDVDTPVTKQVTAVLTLVPVRHDRTKTMCINCGRCVTACPEKLLPNYIVMRAVLADTEGCRALHIDECIECGACAYICPGRVPIVELVKNIKKAAKSGEDDLE
jgi:electron transport complex protein RnfC